MTAVWQLSRPGLLAAVLLSMAVAAVTSGAEPPPWPRLANALVGTGLLVAGAVAMNQRLERDADAAMLRTARRPLPTEALSPRAVAAFAAGASIAGAVWLAIAVAATVGALAILGWGLYVAIYTPLKRRSVWQTPVGAAAGAVPMLLGAAVAEAPWTPMAAALFGMVFFWQFPHTMAVGWLYRDQYQAGGFRVAAVADPTGRLSGWLALAGAAGLLLASLTPSLLGRAAWPYAAVAAAGGLLDLAAAARFLRQPSDPAARILGRVSGGHLLTLLAALLLSA